MDKVLTGTKKSVLFFNPCSLSTVNTVVALPSFFLLNYYLLTHFMFSAMN